MKIILAKNYPKLGKRGEVREVASGFARNFLIPREIVFPATEKNMNRVNDLMVGESKKGKEVLKKLVLMKDKINGIQIEILKESDKEGKLFGGVTLREIQMSLEEKVGFKMPKLNIKLDKPIKKIGDYEIRIEVSKEENLIVKIKIKAKKESGK